MSPAPRYFPLGPLAAVSDPGSAGFVVERDGERIGVLVVRRGGQVFAYVNSCPHVGVPLDFTPGRFLDSSHTHILCSSHGALFQLNTGYCVSGPCAGKSLRPVELVHSDGMLIAALD